VPPLLFALSHPLLRRPYSSASHALAGTGSDAPSSSARPWWDLGGG
jgi:hypothetical protein